MKSWQIVILGMFAFVAVWSLMNSNPGGAVVTLVVVAALAVLFLNLNKKEKKTQPKPPIANSPGVYSNSSQQYRVSIDWGLSDDDEMEQCLIDKSPFVQPDAKRLGEIKTYVVIDTETTGLNCKSDKIVEISLARYSDGQMVDQYTTLINPCCHIPALTTAIHHIRDEDVAAAPTFEKAWSEISRFFDGSVIVGHNVAFDLNMVGHNMPASESTLTVQYLDTVRLAKDAFPGQEDYKLQTLVERLGIADNQQHRAEADVDLTAKLFEMCRSAIIERYEKELKERMERKAKDKAERKLNYSWSPLFDKNFVFTGEFTRNREELQEALNFVGANLRTKINTKTRYLVCGRLENLPQWALERKYGAAQKMIESGVQIQILSEDEYINLINSTHSLKPEK